MVGDQRGRSQVCPAGAAWERRKHKTKEQLTQQLPYCCFVPEPGRPAGLLQKDDLPHTHFLFAFGLESLTLKTGIDPLLKSHRNLAPGQKGQVLVATEGSSFHVGASVEGVGSMCLVLRSVVRGL